MNLATLKRYMKLVVKLPIRQVFAKVMSKSQKAMHGRMMRRRDFKVGSYGHKGSVTSPLLCRFPVGGIGAVMPHASLLAITDLYLEHRFDLLGSGWVRVQYGMTCNGLEAHRYPAAETPVFDSAGHWLLNRINASNLSYSQYVWSLIGDGYLPIDWHIDFKSGYRWQEQVWYRDIRFAHLPGVDVKVPWELARMQHLPQLAQAYAAAVNGIEGFASAQMYLDEFRHQVLDFIALNPPRFGVNWVCSMDVGIRVANCLLAYDLFASAGAVFDEQFDDVFRLSIYQHGKHIVQNLEWHPVYRGNHYLADIVGLLFVSSYLASNPEIDAWLAFGVQELISEVNFQFYSDGSNFEASTSYHRLSAELAVYGTALVLGLRETKRAVLSKYDCRLVKGTPSLNPAPIKLFPVAGSDIESPFPDWYWERLERMAEFTKAVMRPDGQSPQIGDTDNGRLFKLSPRYEALPLTTAREQFSNLASYEGSLLDETYWFEIQNDHRHLIAAASGFFERADFDEISIGLQCERSTICTLAKNVRVPSYFGRMPGPKRNTSSQNFLRSEPNAQRYTFSTGTSGLNQYLDSSAFHDFGLFLYKSKRLYLAIRCGSIGLNDLGAHAHNDALAIELWLDGKPLVVDAGTYLYTSLPFRRDEFRSVEAHFSPRIQGVEPNNMSQNVFSLGNEAKAECLYFSEGQFLGRYSVGCAFIYRYIKVCDSSVDITDWISEDARCLARLDHGVLPYSPGYGWRCR